jgi:hypothetical protein
MAMDILVHPEGLAALVRQHQRELLDDAAEHRRASRARRRRRV